MRYMKIETYWMRRSGLIDIIPYFRIQYFGIQWDKAEENYYCFDIETGWLGRWCAVEWYFRKGSSYAEASEDEPSYAKASEGEEGGSDA
jgi:hypothetical protein